MFNMIMKDLEDFINAAEKSRKYPRSTAAAKRSALRLFGAELNDYEAQSLDSFEKNFEQIYQEVVNKNKANMSASSLITYKRRVSGLIKDYKNYGLDPTKMANWNRPLRKVSEKVSNSKRNEQEAHQGIELPKDANMARFELPLREGVKAIISVPSDMTKEEVGKIKKYVDFLESISSVSKNPDNHAQ